MTATQTKPETETFTFTSKRTDLLVYLTPDKTLHHPDGTREDIRGITAQFGSLRHGFAPGQFVASEEIAEQVGCDSLDDLVSRLRASKHFNDDFFEIKVEPVAPDHTDTLIRVATLIASGDLEALFALEQEEREGWAREPILTAIEGAVEALKARAVAEQGDRPDEG